MNMAPWPRTDKNFKSLNKPRILVVPGDNPKKIRKQISVFPLSAAHDPNLKKRGL